MFYQEYGRVKKIAVDESRIDGASRSSTGSGDASYRLEKRHHVNRAHGLNTNVGIRFRLPYRTGRFEKEREYDISGRRIKTRVRGKTVP